MVKEIAFYQFNFLDSISERINARLEKLNNIYCKVYQNSKYAIIVYQRENILECERTGYPEYRKVYLFSAYKESLVEVTSDDYKTINATIQKIMEQK